LQMQYVQTCSYSVLLKRRNTEDSRSSLFILVVRFLWVNLLNLLDDFLNCGNHELTASIVKTDNNNSAPYDALKQEHTRSTSSIILINVGNIDGNNSKILTIDGNQTLISVYACVHESVCVCACGSVCACAFSFVCM
jgi:hypothetical protein